MYPITTSRWNDSFKIAYNNWSQVLYQFFVEKISNLNIHIVFFTENLLL